MLHQQRDITYNFIQPIKSDLFETRRIVSHFLNAKYHETLIQFIVSFAEGTYHRMMSRSRLTPDFLGY